MTFAQRETSVLVQEVHPDVFTVLFIAGLWLLLIALIALAVVSHRQQRDAERQARLIFDTQPELFDLRIYVIATVEDEPRSAWSFFMPPYLHEGVAL